MNCITIKYIRADQILSNNYRKMCSKIQKCFPSFFHLGRFHGTTDFTEAFLKWSDFFAWVRKIFFRWGQIFFTPHCADPNKDERVHKVRSLKGHHWTYILEVDHFCVSVVLNGDVVQQNIHHPGSLHWIIFWSFGYNR